MNNAPWKIGIDIGGAFTDLYAINQETEESFWVKVESTPPQFEVGVINGISELEAKGIKMSQVSQIIHGQTVVINTIITRNGANVGFITTKGFDILEIQRANRRDIFNYKYKKPEPFVSRYMTEHINERMDSNGLVYRPIRREEVEEATLSLLKKGAESFAIGFINSYQNPTHERIARDIVEEVCKKEGIKSPYITISSDLSREWREYERFNTAVLNAYVQPIFVKYIESLERILKKRGFRGTFYITLAAGGMATSTYAKYHPITTVEGGPISGIIGGLILGKLIGENNIIILDGGSTTTKAGLAKDFTPEVKTEYWIEQDDWNSGYPARVPIINIHEIGTGGTSLIWIDEAGNLQVGPKAAGARPGPVCYGVGGTQPTLTDAYVIAGYLNPNYLLGGRLKIHKDLAEDVFRELAKDMGMDPLDVAYSAIRIANDNSSNLIRLISIRRGFDPRDFALLAHGGSGPMFAPFIAEELGISKIIVPSIPSGVFNSWGMIGLDIRHELVQTTISIIEETKKFADFMNEIFGNLEKEIKSTFEKEGISPETVEIERYLDLKYRGQAHTLKISVKAKEIGVNEIKDVEESFHKKHYDNFGFRLNESPIEIVNFHIAGIHKVKHPKLEKKQVDNTLQGAYLGEREVYIDGKLESIPIFKKELIPHDSMIQGPAIVEGITATIIITKSFRAIEDLYGNLIMTRKGGD